MKKVTSNYDKQVDIGKNYFLKYDQQLLAKNFIWKQMNSICT